MKLGGVVFDDADVIDEEFAGFEQADLQLVPEVEADVVFGGDVRVGDGLPGAGLGFFAGCPRAGDAVVGVWVLELEAGAAAVGARVPFAGVVVADFVGGVAVAGLRG